MNYVDLIAVLAVAQLMFFGVLVGQARGKYNVKAPAVTGADGFERVYRVQMNTLEQIVMFLPALYIAARYWPAIWVAGLGLVYLVGRILYWRAYTRDPSSRGLGFLLSFAPTVLLLLVGLAGAIGLVKA